MNPGRRERESTDLGQSKQKSIELRRKRRGSKGRPNTHLNPRNEGTETASMNSTPNLTGRVGRSFSRCRGREGSGGNLPEWKDGENSV